MINQTTDTDLPNVELEESFLGFEILVDGVHAGAIEGYAGFLEYIEVEVHFQRQGVARAAIREFERVSAAEDCGELVATNATNDVSKHLLETEGFEPADGDGCWAKDIDDA